MGTARPIPRRPPVDVSVLCFLLAAALAGGCATIVEGGAQTVRVDTDPPGARCVITRAGVAVSTIPSTPATVSLFKESGDLALRCSKPGYLDSDAAQSAEFSGTVFGNILFGGLIGAAIDMGSGATHKYPDEIFVTLVPERFAGPAARDAFFAALVERVRHRHRLAVDSATQQCQAAEDDCDAAIGRLDDALGARLQAIEAQRRSAAVDGGA
ncbi:MAG: hypothetical protein QNJ91_18400 [Gammaproteobacteria bacterium]|nr:hypothetical protein [Gammaproteobacteria bacterium]